MQMNPRPAKSLNQRPVKQLNGQQPVSAPAMQNVRPSVQLQPVPRQAPSVQNVQTQGASVPTSPSTQGMQVNNTSSNPTFMHQKPKSESNSTMVSNPAMSNPIMSFVARMFDMVSSFAILSDDVVAQNVQLALSGFSAEDRILPYEVADYLMSNMGYIFMGLVLDANFKNAFLESLRIEMQIDKQPENIQKATRTKMKTDKKYNTRGAAVVGTSDFVPEVKAALTRRMQQSFSALDSFADEFDAEISHLTRNQKLEYGFIFSNFMYLLRAFTHNDLFMSYVISVIEKVKAMTGNK